MIKKFFSLFYFSDEETQPTDGQNECSGISSGIFFLSSRELPVGEICV